MIFRVAQMMSRVLANLLVQVNGLRVVYQDDLSPMPFSFGAQAAVASSWTVLAAAATVAARHA